MRYGIKALHSNQSFSNKCFDGVELFVQGWLQKIIHNLLVLSFSGKGKTSKNNKNKNSPDT
jgi:hypothetical protein